MIKKRGQVTIFIIIAVVFISLIAFYFLAKNGIVPGITSKKEITPNAFLKSCIEEKIEEGISILSLQGGSIENTFNKTFTLLDEKESHDISYLCYTSEDNKLCVNQETKLIEHVEDEIHDYISSDLEDCFDSLVQSLEKDNYQVNKKYNKFKVDLTERGVSIDIDGEITLSKTEETSTQKDLGFFSQSQIYNILLIAQDIVNQEADSCDFNYALFVMNYPRFNIEKIRTSDSEKIYIISDKETNENFRFAIRGCVMSI